MRGVLSGKPQQLQISSPGQKWAAGLVVSRVRAAAGIEKEKKDMRKSVTRFVRERRKAHLNAKGRPDAKARKLMAASSTAQPPGVVKTLTAAVLPPYAPLPRPPLTEKEPCWLNAADKKQSDADKQRKRPVKKRRDSARDTAECRSRRAEVDIGGRSMTGLGM
eukprot:jgi/Tetstr1/420776/TSEL_011853.t1